MKMRMIGDLQEAFLVSQLEQLVEDAVSYALKRLKAEKMPVRREDLYSLLKVCPRLMKRKLGELPSDMALKYMEFYKFYKKYIEDRAWYIIWRILGLRGVKVRRIILSDRIGGEGLRSGRYFMGRDIDYLIVVDGDLDRAKREASEVENILNRVVGEKLREILGRKDVKELEECKAFSLFEMQVFGNESEAKAWGILKDFGRDKYARVRAREVLSSP